MGGVSWGQVLAWRLERQFLADVDGGSALEVVRRLCGVQAQVPSAAALAIAVRQAKPDTDAVPKAIAAKTLLRTWSMRGTLHLLPVQDAGGYLSLLANARTWTKGSWQKHYLSTREVDALSEAVTAVLADGAALTRDELVAAVVEQSGSASLGEHVSSGWGTVLKPLSWQGLICQGPAQGTRVTFVRPDAWFPRWRGLPEPDEAARAVIPAFLGAHGPSTAERFDQWLLAGSTPRKQLRGWFADLGDELATVEVEGERLVARAEDVDAIAAARPSTAVRLLPGFDQWVLGPGTKDERIVPAARRSRVSRTAGWISPVVLRGGRVVGVWDAGQDGTPEVDAWEDVPAAALRAEKKRVAGLAARRSPS